MKKVVTGLSAAVIVAAIAIYVYLTDPAALYPAFAEAKASGFGRNASADGTFIQWWLVKDWDDWRWIREYRILKEAGMQYAVLTPTAIYESGGNGKSGVTKTLYPSEQPGFQVLKDKEGNEYSGIVDACLRNAQKMGIKVFLGLNFSEEWWSKGRSAEWIKSRMLEGNRIVDDLWELYRSKYPDAFYGWYWCWEIDNGKFSTLDFNGSKKMLSDAIRIQLDHMENTGKRLPFMLAPFMDWKLGTPERYAKTWEYVFVNSGMKSGDIFSPQDCIGAGGLNMGNYTKWFSELRKAVDKKPGIQLWATTETFNVNDWTAATIDRFIRQMNDLRPYVDNFITFSYSHYYSPYLVDKGFHRTYAEYVKTGKLESLPPCVPSGLKAAAEPGGKISINWDASHDNTGVGGYYVYRNGRLIKNLQVKRGDRMLRGNDADTSMEDASLKPGELYIYEVQAYDFAGNVSPKTVPVAIYAR